MDWQTTFPPNGIEIELETTEGLAFTGAVSFVKRLPEVEGRQRALFQLRDGRRGLFEVQG